MSGRELDPDGTDSFHPDHPWEQTTHPMYVVPGARTSGNWPPVDAEPAGPHEASIWAALPHGRRGDIKRMIPVPESLIERISSAYDASNDTLAALIEQLWMLSQPEPSAEQVACPHWEPGQITMRNGCTACTAEAAPPSITEMAPGTQFKREGYPGEMWTVKRDICDGGVYVFSDGHRSQNAEAIDPSTIRDVTPPNGAER